MFLILLVVLPRHRTAPAVLLSREAVLLLKTAPAALPLPEAILPLRAAPDLKLAPTALPHLLVVVATELTLALRRLRGVVPLQTPATGLATAPNFRGFNLIVLVQRVLRRTPQY